MSEAIDTLEVSRPLDHRDFDLPRYRGNAYLAAGHPDLAEKEFREVLAHQDSNPAPAEYPLSWLGLARSLSAQGNRSGAINAYHHFLTLWDHADADDSYLTPARHELRLIEALK
jgi:eukaryotic-like serine/threonine-protein kinase